VYWVVEAFGSVFSFTIIHILKMLVTGLAGTLLICFGRDLERLRRAEPDVVAKLEEQYRNEASLVASPIYRC
jgi:hypothetical protein